MRPSRLTVAPILATLLLAPALAQADDYYVSIARGKGKEATKENPAKDLGNIVAKLKDGDTIHLAEGVYNGRDEAGADAIGVAVKIVGGWKDDFSARDPWGAHKTILTGTNAISGSTAYRLLIETKKCGSDIVVDGIVFDNGPRNQYSNDKQVVIVRQANATKGLNSSPESGALKVIVGENCKVAIKNNVVMNTAPTGGAIYAQGHMNADITIENNLVINNTGEGIFAMTKWQGRDYKDAPKFHIARNTILFSWKHDAIGSYGGNALKFDTMIQATVSQNVFGFGDYGGVDNIKKAQGVTLKDNLFTGNRLYDYREFNTSVKVDELADEADLLTPASTGNVSMAIKVPVSNAWAGLYAGRKEISRAEVDAKAKAANSGANQIRSMLGLPLQANAVNVDVDVWLPRMQLADALAVGKQAYEGKYGCHKP